LLLLSLARCFSVTGLDVFTPVASHRATPDQGLRDCTISTIVFIIANIVCAEFPLVAHRDMSQHHISPVASGA
jgi:hypothetical protein